MDVIGIGNHQSSVWNEMLPYLNVAHSLMTA